MDRSTGCSASFLDPDASLSTDCTEYRTAMQPLGAHMVPLGMRFYDGTMFPSEFTNAVFIAERGQSSEPGPGLYGYRIVVVRLSSDGTMAVNHEVFAEGWYHNETISGRPVDVAILEDGSMVVSDDFNDKIYRITYNSTDRDELIFDSSVASYLSECDYSYANLSYVAGAFL